MHNRFLLHWTDCKNYGRISQFTREPNHEHFLYDGSNKKSYAVQKVETALVIIRHLFHKIQIPMEEQNHFTQNFEKNIRIHAKVHACILAKVSE